MDIILRSDVKVELLGHYGTDLDIARAAWVSSGADPEEPSEKRLRGVLRALLRDKHSCYDDKTEVLTDSGWKLFKDVSDSDKVATLDISNNTIEYLIPERVVSFDFEGELIHIQTQHLDLAITPGHKMVASAYNYEKGRGNSAFGWEDISLNHVSEDFLEHPFRIPLSGGVWKKDNGVSELTEREAEFIGFTLGDGHVTPYSGVYFHLHKERKIDYICSLCDELNLNYSHNLDTRTIYVHKAPGFANILSSTYSESGRKVPEAIRGQSPEVIRSFLKGFIEADGHISRSGKITVSAKDREVLEGIQELLLKTGSLGKITEITRPSGFNPDEIVTIYRMIIHRGRNTFARVGWTKEERGKQVTRPYYKGRVWCATTKNGTLYVRRSGKTAWCGNTPFETGYFQFYVEAPRAVRDEAVRHRSASFSCSSLRYTHESPEVYIPGPNRPIKKAEGFKQIQPKYEPLDRDEYKAYVEALKQGYTSAYQQIQFIRETLGREETEATRWLTLDGTYCSFIMRVNPRGLMNFLSLRTHEPESNHPSYPLWEIELVARRMEDSFREKLPLTYEFWNQFGREAV